MLVIHDLDKMHFPEAGIAHHMGQLYGGGIKALEELKASGEIKAFGAGINHTGTMRRFLDHGIDLDFFLVSQIYRCVLPPTRPRGALSAWTCAHPPRADQCSRWCAAQPDPPRPSRSADRFLRGRPGRAGGARACRRAWNGGEFSTALPSPPPPFLLLRV